MVVGTRRDKRGRRVVRQPHRPRPRNWGYWCWGQNSKGRYVALGSFSTSSQAHEEGYGAYPGEFEVFLLDTINLAAAKQRLKALTLKRGKTIDEAMRYASSELP